MEYRDGDTGLLHQKVGRFISINERFHPDSDFWNGPAGRTDRSPLSTFTSSVFLAAPPPSAAMRTHQQHCISPSSRSRSPETRSRSPETRSRSETFESRATPKQHSYSHSSHFISDLSSHDYPGRPLTSSFYMTTRPTSPERSTRVFPFKLTCNANSSSRVRYSSTGSAGSPSSTDSGTVSFDFSLPAQSSLVIDANNVSPRYQENTMEAIFSDSGNYSDCDTKTDGLTNPVTSVHHIDLNCNKSKVVVRKQINELNRRASFEIHATNPELGAQIPSNENRFSRRHSIHDDQSVALSQGRFAIDADINNNKYRDYEEEMLVDLLKKCTDFSERRRIRSALRYVRENNKESSCAKSERSTVFIPFREVAGENNCAHATTSTLKLSPREVKKEQITPVLTSTPREITLCSLEECAGEKTSVSSSFSDVDEHNSELRESSCLFDVQGVKLVKSYGHLILEESDEGFPQVIGAVDCTQIRIQAPVGREQDYVNRKGFHSINVQMVCDADMVITNVVAQWPGSVHDSRIFSNCQLYRELLQDKGVPHQSGKGEGRDRGAKTIPGTAKKTSGSRDTKKTSAPLTRPQRTQKSPSANKGDAVTTTGSDTTAKQSPVVKTEQLQRKELPKAGTRQVVLQKAVSEKTDAKARPKSAVTKDSSATQGSFRSLQKETSTAPKRSVSSSAACLVKKPSDEKRDSQRVTTSPRRKLPDVTLVADQKQTTKTSPRSSSQTSTRAVSDKSKTLGKKSVSVLKPSENSKSGSDESDVFIVKTQAEKIVIPKIIISDETDDTECDVTNKSSEESLENLSGMNTQKDKPKYYRKKERDSLPKKGGTVTEIKMSTASPVMTTAQKPVKMDLVNNNNGSSQSVGADLEKAFTDLLDNFDSIGENDTRVIEKQTDVQCERDTLGENNNTIAKSSEINNLNLQEHGIGNEVKMESQDETECSEPQERLVSKDLTEEKAVDTEDENNRPLEASEDVFDMDRLGDVKVEESEDGSLTVTDVQEFNEGQRKVSVTTKKKRTDSEVEVQDKETTITTTFQSPSGTKYEEQDVIKTRRKLTPKGSIYIKRDAVKTKRAFSRTGEQTVEEDHVVETDNKSVSLGKSWGDKTMTTTVLSKPTKSERTIHAIQEEPHLDKAPTSEEGKQEENLELGTIPDILSILADQVVTVGSRVVLQCEGSGKPTPEVTWYAGDSVLTETAYFKLSFDGKTATLTITEAFPDDEKLYRCVFRNKHGSAETSGRLRVKVPNIEEVPSITTALEDIEATPKQRVTLSCRVTGLGEVFWHKEGTRLGDSPRHKLSLNSGWAELEISEVSLDDAGQYSCSVKNSAGEASTICQLLVSEEGCPPDILNPLFNCTAAEGKPFKLLCRISGDPPPSVRWLHDGRELLVSDNSKISYEDNIARLELKTVSPSDKGIYECIGTNSLGSASTNCELCVKESVRPTKASIQLSLKSVSKSVDSNDTGDLTEGVRRLEASQSLDIPSSHSSSSSNAEDIYCVGTVRSCTPPPQQPISCSPPRNEIRTCSPPRSNISHISSNISSQNGSCLNTTPTQNTPQHLYGQSDSATKTSAVNRLQNFFGGIMNNNSSPAPCIRSPTEDVLVETKSSFVVRRQENGSQNIRGVSLDLSPNQVKDGGPSSGGELFGDLTNIHRDIIMSQKISEIEDDEVLHKMLNTTDNFDDRKAIRARLKELREKAREEWERAKKEREAAVVDVVKLKHQRAEQDKQRRMQNFQTRAETAGKDLEDKYLAQSQKDLQERQRFAADEKQKKLDAYKQIAKTGSGVSETRVSTSKSDSGVSETRVTTTSSTDKDGSTTRTTTTKTVTVQQTGGKADVAHNIVNQLQNESSPYTSGKITVKTEAWDSRDGVVKKSETTQRWGANKPAGARGAMAAFKQMDSLNPTQAAKPNALVAVSLAKKAATTMRRNAVQIKAEILDFCKSNTSEYKEVNVTNFSSSWNNGMAFCALIHHFYPESFDFSKLDPKQRRKNFELAFDTAEKEADIAPLLDVEDMVKMKNPDWKCVFTYVQSFYRHLRNHPRCKQIAPVTQ